MLFKLNIHEINPKIYSQFKIYIFYSPPNKTYIRFPLSIFPSNLMLNPDGLFQLNIIAIVRNEQKIDEVILK